MESAPQFEVAVDETTNDRLSFHSEVRRYPAPSPGVGSFQDLLLPRLQLSGLRLGQPG